MQYRVSLRVEGVHKSAHGRCRTCHPRCFHLLLLSQFRFARITIDAFVAHSPANTCSATTSSSSNTPSSTSTCTALRCHRIAVAVASRRHRSRKPSRPPLLPHVRASCLVLRELLLALNSPRVRDGAQQQPYHRTIALACGDVQGRPALAGGDGQLGGAPSAEQSGRALQVAFVGAQVERGHVALHPRLRRGGGPQPEQLVAYREASVVAAHVQRGGARSGHVQLEHGAGVLLGAQPRRRGGREGKNVGGGIRGGGGRVVVALGRPRRSCRRRRVRRRIGGLLNSQGRPRHAPPADRTPAPKHGGHAVAITAATAADINATVSCHVRRHRVSAATSHEFRRLPPPRGNVRRAFLRWFPPITAAPRSFGRHELC
mmetsp:Transcript_53211/g.98996  ORF Transcript_53211/g.98996 Transcript_53211/m.98996 type:complete len:373 (-) Transcript_53211:959-2077(-)